MKLKVSRAALEQMTHTMSSGQYMDAVYLPLTMVASSTGKEGLWGKEDDSCDITRACGDEQLVGGTLTVARVP